MESLKPVSKVSMSVLQFLILTGVLVGFGWLCSEILYDIRTELISVKWEIAFIKLQLGIKGY